jgi:hypothetical protein
MAERDRDEPQGSTATGGKRRPDGEGRTVPAGEIQQESPAEEQIETAELLETHSEPAVDSPGLAGAEPERPDWKRHPRES